MVLTISVTRKGEYGIELMFDDDCSIYTILLTERKRKQLIKKLEELK